MCVRSINFFKEKLLIFLYTEFIPCIWRNCIRCSEYCRGNVTNQKKKTIILWIKFAAYLFLSMFAVWAWVWTLFQRQSHFFFYSREKIRWAGKQTLNYVKTTTIRISMNPRSFDIIVKNDPFQLETRKNKNLVVNYLLILVVKCSTLFIGDIRN